MEITKLRRRALALLGCATLWMQPFMHIHAANLKPEPIHAGDAYHIDSKATGEQRRYLVHLPKDYEFVKDTYPVLIHLDGDEHFHLISATMDLLSSTERIPPMIVVGVPNTNRFRDLSPLPPVASGGAAREDHPQRFLQFIADELIPEIDRNYRTKSSRVLVGHSVGGLFTLYALMNRPATFKGYISISPAFADNRALVKEVEPFLLAHKDLRVDFYMTMANERGAQLGGAWELSSILQEKAPREVRWQFQRHPEENHFSVVHRSVYDGLQAIFQGWYLQDPFALYEQGGLAAIDRYYAGLSTRAGYPVPVPERTLTFLLNSLGQRNRHAEGEAIATRVIDAHPDSSNAQFTLGRFFFGMNDKPRAIRHLTRTLEIYPDNGTARGMLTKLDVDASKIAPPVEVPSRVLESYLGRYQAEGVELRIAAENGGLYAINALSRHRLQPISTTHFYCVDGDKHFVFRSNSGKVVGLTVRQRGADLEMTRAK